MKSTLLSFPCLASSARGGTADSAVSGTAAFGRPGSNPGERTVGEEIESGYSTPFAKW